MNLLLIIVSYLAFGAYLNNSDIRLAVGALLIQLFVIREEIRELKELTRTSK